MERRRVKLRRGTTMKKALFTLVLGFLTVSAAAQAPGRGGWRVSPRPTPSAEPEALPWGVSAAAHLMRRAGFSASREELDRIVKQGFEATLDELLHPETVDDREMEAGLEARNYQLTRVRNNQDGLRVNGENLQRWWLYRMINSRRQLQEKMTYFWHDHFATSAQKVNFVNGEGEPLMLVQNDILRTHALGNFKEMVLAVARDPAMIVWLDNFSNVAGSPNENWARELLELFTMGEGNGYTELDIQEAARAFTGWTLSRRNLQFAFNPRTHDDGPKTVLGQTIQSPPGPDGIADGERVVDAIFERPETARYIAGKLWDFFVYPDPPEEVVGPLAEVFRESGYELRALMRAIFEHPHFMSTKAYRAKIKSPVELVADLFREMEVRDPDNLPGLTYFFGLGQNLFYPPDVGGWTTDVGWINTGTALARYNLTTCITSNRPGENFVCSARDGRGSRPSPAEDQIDVEGIIARNDLKFAVDMVDYFVTALVQDDASIDTRYALEQYMTTGDDGLPEEFDVADPTAVDKKVRGLIYLIALLPVYQLN